MKKIIWSQKAINSLQRLVHFIDKKWNRSVADKLLDEIEKTLERIAFNPFLYPVYSQKKNLRRCVIKKKTILFYRVVEEKIEIILLVDARQNPANFKL